MKALAIARFSLVQPTLVGLRWWRNMESVASKIKEAAE